MFSGSHPCKGRKQDWVREKLGCNAASARASAHPGGRSEAGIALIVVSHCSEGAGSLCLHIDQTLRSGA